MLNVGIIIGSTRPNRVAPAVAEWVANRARGSGGANFELVDLVDYDLPLLDEPHPPSLGGYVHEHTLRWARRISSLDAFVFVVPEYNHSIPGPLKNAIDFIYAEWANKAAAFVSYGSANGVRAVEHLRCVMGELQVADVRSHVGLSIFDDFENFSIPKPRPIHGPAFASMFDQLIGWGEALKSYRAIAQ